MNRRLMGCLLLASALSIGACRRQHTEPPVPADESAGPVLVHVDNHNWSDVVVHVGHAGVRNRLGTARAATRTDFSFPAQWASGAVRLVLIAEPIGSNERFTSEAFYLQPGQQVDWTLESGLSRSSLAIR
jgi:hypothetical protein